MRAPHLALRFLALAALAAGCGGVSSPDLGEGEVEGKLLGAAPGSYAYALGAASVRAYVGGEGEWKLHAPAGTTHVVIYDASSSAAAPGGRAELVPVAVSGAEHEDLPARYGDAAQVSEDRKMPPAGAVLATVAASGGGVCVDPRFEVEGTEASGTASGATSLRLAPLPEGTFRVTVSVAGHGATSLPVAVVRGQTTAVDLVVDGRCE